MSALESAPGAHSACSAKLLVSKATKNDRERRNDAHADHRAFCRCRCVAGRNASWQRAIGVFISMVRDLTRLWWWLWWWNGLLLHELGAVQDHNVRHRRKLHRESILPRAIDTAAAPFIGEATPSPARPNG